MKYLKDIQNLVGVKVLLRLDLNVPIANGKIVDDFRIKKILPTLNYLRERKAHIIIVSHIEGDGGKTLAPVAEYLQKFVTVHFVENWRNAKGEIDSLSDGECVLLENVRIHEGEKEDSEKFAKELASLADIYVNEAFAVSHRKHASVDAITHFLPSYAGMLFQNEVENVGKAFNPPHPFLFVLCGAKFETKVPLIEKFMKIADFVFVGGALANNFFKEQGKEIGKSLVSSENFNLDRYFNDPKLLLPQDVVVETGGTIVTKDVAEIGAEDVIVDAGPKTLAMLKEKIKLCEFVLWNGPLGAYEKGYKQPTLDLAKAIADAKAQSVVGGGDTLATIAELGNEDKFTFVSTGGGAMLEYLANGTLPAIEALESSKVEGV